LATVRHSMKREIMIDASL